jgi:ribosomal protein L5
MMYEFLDGFQRSSARVRDFRGVSTLVRRKRNYTMGLRDQLIFGDFLREGRQDCGMNVTIVRPREAF